MLYEWLFWLDVFSVTIQDMADRSMQMLTYLNITLRPLRWVYRCVQTIVWNSLVSHPSKREQSPILTYLYFLRITDKRIASTSLTSSPILSEFYILSEWHEVGQVWTIVFWLMWRNRRRIANWYHIHFELTCTLVQ